MGFEKEAFVKYELVVKDLALQIKNGTFQPNSQLPSIEALCQHYEVSKVTIKKALDILEAQGLITRRRGSGSFVKNVRTPREDNVAFETSRQMDGFTAEHARRGEAVRTDVKDFTVVSPSPEVAYMLDIEPDQFVYHVVRVRFAEDVATAVEYTYMPIDVIPNLRLKHVETSIYRYIENDLGLKIASGHRIVRAVLPTEDECAWMDLEPTEPLLEVEQVGYLDDGTPFEYSFARHPRGYEFRSISTK